MYRLGGGLSAVGGQGIQIPKAASHSSSRQCRFDIDLRVWHVGRHTAEPRYYEITFLCGADALASPSILPNLDTLYGPLSAFFYNLSQSRHVVRIYKIHACGREKLGSQFGVGHAFVSRLTPATAWH